MWWWVIACRAPTEPGTEPTDGAPTDVAPTGTVPTADTASPPHSAAVDPEDLPGNVLIFVADDFGVDHVGAYHATDADLRTPVIDSLAASGTLFRNAWSYTACSPARAALSTGRHARRTGYGVNWAIGGFPWSLPEDEVTLPELLEASPWHWATSYVGKYHLTSDNLPNLEGTAHRQGWRFFAGPMASTLRLPPEPKGPDGHYFWWKKTLDDETTTITTTYATTDTANDAEARIAVMREPWLMVVAFNAIHEPLHVPPDELHTYDGLTEKSDTRALARAMTEAMDTEMGRVLRALAPDVRARTTIVFVGDNGDNENTVEPPLPEARFASATTTTTEPEPGPNFAKGSLRDMGIRVPLIVAGPHVARPGVPTDALASIVDVFATVAEIAEAEPPRPIDGVSLLPVLADPTATVQDVIFTERVAPLGLLPALVIDQRVARNARYKLTRDVLTGAESLFEYREGQVGEGTDLLDGSLTADELAAYEELSAAIDEKFARMADEG